MFTVLYEQRRNSSNFEFEFWYKSKRATHGPLVFSGDEFEFWYKSRRARAHRPLAFCSDTSRRICSIDRMCSFSIDTHRPQVFSGDASRGARLHPQPYPLCHWYEEAYNDPHQRGWRGTRPSPGGATIWSRVCGRVRACQSLYRQSRAASQRSVS